MLHGLQATVGRSMGFDPSHYDLAEADNGVEAPLHAPGGPGHQSGPAQSGLPQGGHLLVSHPF